MELDEPVTRHLWISGRVQGVWYRESMRLEAVRLGVNGWVRNHPDGRVEAVISGRAEQVEELIAWAKRGPPLARVTKVDSEPAQGHFSTFETR
ncbi:MAG TPA: acylphosphatase [Thiobacillaceae bacterium]|nr:acylphosphatase [Thiobacillaceae bacterium]